VNHPDYDENLKTSLDNWLKDGSSKRESTLECFLKDYEITCAELKRHDNIVLVIGTIIITASFLILGSDVIKDSGNPKGIYTFASIGLYAIWLLVLHDTSKKFDKLLYNRIKAMEEATTNYTGYSFGVYSYLFKNTLAENDKTKTKLWLRLRRSFWGLILLFLSIAWLLISIT
jgi:hypothetical protein